MGNMKELMFDEERDRREGWIACFYPDAEKNSEEWHSATEDYANFQEWETQIDAQVIFAASLASVRDRYLDASEELSKLRKLNLAGQPDLIRRMSIVHAVTVMDAFLMYSARALLSYPSHLALFIERSHQLMIRKEDVRRLRDTQWFEQEPETSTPSNVYRWRAQAIVSQMTFQSRTSIERYFTTLLQTSHRWPLEAIESVTRTRNHLVHRNGIDLNDEPIFPGTADVDYAITSVTAVINAAADTILQEEALL